ncbi:activator-dependent family glycosyltransferase [Salinispora fenicalii]|uniref:activator-dependent family glycosyltransferase n=1 Tax=Salinispora fenicalii TaxID=1137263 RepID=UPI0004844390|nr:activator-dependent family glycosyltransferase [Salinispora fenicalii]
MRVLIGILPAAAHFYPVVPLAWALSAAGHEVCVTTHPDMNETITASGLSAAPVGGVFDLTAAVGATFHNPVLTRIADALDIDPGDTNLDTAVRHYMLAPFAAYHEAGASTAASSAVDDLVSIARRWEPDLVLWDPLFFPGAIAAAACGAAHARLLWGLDHMGWTRLRFRERLQAADSGISEDLMAEVLEPTLKRYGLTFSEELLLGQWTIDPMPARMRLPLDVRTVPMRWVPYNSAAVIPPWTYAAGDRPRVCLTLGVSGRKFFTRDGAISLSDLFEIVAGMDIEVVATLDQKQLTSITVPDNVRTVDFIPLNLLLPTCAGIVHHGGAGTFATAVAHQVPQLVIPTQGGDFPDIARYVAAQGAGLTIEGAGLSAETLGDHLERLLTDSSLRTGTAALHRDMLATPSPSDIVPLLEKLMAEHRQ